MYTMKTTMDKNTILYILDDEKFGHVFARAYNREYLRRNYNTEFNRIAKANKVFFKAGDGFDTWIDYNKAIKNNSGTYDKRIAEALKNEDMRLSDDLREIPTSIYTDMEGYEHVIPPNDGMINKIYWLEREDRGIFEPKVTPIIRDMGSEKQHEIDLLVEFDVVVDDALITLNSFFYEYEQLSPHKILYRNIGSELPQIKPFNDNDNSMTYYDYNIKVYKWKGLKKLPERRPIERTERNTIRFEQQIGPDGILVYNGLAYEYKVVNNYELLLVDVTPEQLEKFNLDEITFTKFVSPDGRDIVCSFTAQGIMNNLSNEATFVKSVHDSLILFNGMDCDYEVMDAFSVKFPISGFGVGSVANDTKVLSVSFYYGKQNGGACIPNDFTPPDISEILNRYDKYIKDLLRKVMNDYQDELNAETYETNRFTLEFKPIRDTVSLYINGVRYDKDDHFIYDAESNTVQWTFTKDVGGFDLKEKYNYTAMYDFYFEENGILNPSEFIKQYYMKLKH